MLENVKNIYESGDYILQDILLMNIEKEAENKRFDKVIQIFNEISEKTRKNLISN